MEHPGTDFLLQQLEPWLAAPRWWVGLSGGLDSCALLQLLAGLRGEVTLPPLVAIHVDHGLSGNAPSWQQHCRSLCDALAVELVTRAVEIDPAELGPEAAAREARYAVFESLVGEGELLLLAHHLDDQVETFFLRLMRGAGPRGLSGMPRQRRLGRGHLLRPLLDLSRERLDSYARGQGLAWVEDESNRDLALDRNYLRHQVLPALEQRWPGYRGSVVSSMRALAEAESRLADDDSRLLETASARHHGEAVLRLEALTGFEPARLATLLRRWLECLHQQVPGREQLSEYSRQLLAAEPDAQPALAGTGYCLRRFRNAVHFCPDQGSICLPADGVLSPGRELQVPGLGSLLMEPVADGGLRLPRAGHWILKLRSGGERCRPLGREHGQSLKKLLQDSAIPPWQRQRLPLLYADDELAAVADLWICEGQQATAGQGYRLVWNPVADTPSH